MGFENTYIAVICAVGIPIAISVCIAVFFWNRARLRLKREDEELSGYLKKDDVSIYSTAAAVQRGHIDNQVADDKTRDVANGYFGDVTAVPGSSSSVTTNEEKLHQSSDKNGDSAMLEDPKEPRRSTSKYYVPAYRRKLNYTLATAQNVRQLEEASATNSSMTSFETQKAQVSIFEQMVPIVTIENGILGGSQEQSMFFEKSSVNSNDNLMKSLKTHDFGSYPKRKPSIVQINSSTLSTSSPSPSVSRAPSSSSLSKLQREDHSSYFEATPTPRSARISNVESSTDVKGVYVLKNNYDLTNDAEIAEEDQYENEFTNYSENKREFIDSLRPKASKY